MKNKNISVKVWGGHRKGGVQSGQELDTSPEMGNLPMGWKSSCRTFPGVVTVAVLLPQTKEVTKAMNEKKFEEAMKLRGR